MPDLDLSEDDDALDALIADITVDADGADEPLWAFTQVLADELTLPLEASLIGVPVSVQQFDDNGNTLRGLTADCRLAHGPAYRVAAYDLAVPADSPADRLLRAYQRWLDANG
jgi:hypothetical protein